MTQGQIFAQGDKLLKFINDRKDLLHISTIEKAVGMPSGSIYRINWENENKRTPETRRVIPEKYQDKMIQVLTKVGYGSPSVEELVSLLTECRMKHASLGLWAEDIQALIEKRVSTGIEPLTSRVGYK